MKTAAALTCWPRKLCSAAGMLLIAMLGMTAISGCSPIKLGIGDDGDGGSADGPPVVGPHRLASLQITPVNDVLVVDVNLMQEVTKPFKVMALYEDRTVKDVTAMATFTSMNAAAGKLTGATFHTAIQTMNRVEFTVISATYKEGDISRSTVANLTVVWLRQSGDAQDFFFNLPYLDPQQQKPLSFTTHIQSLDAFFAIDTTGSMRGEIVQLRDSLQNTIIPAVKAASVKDAWFGVGAQEDFPALPYGQPNFRPGLPDDQPFILLSPMNANLMAAQNAANNLLSGGAPRGNGQDTPEGHLEALYQIATGEGNSVAGVVNIPAHKTGIGGVEFRSGALPVVTLISDAMFHTKGEPAQACTYFTSMNQPVTEKGDYAGAVANAAHTRTQVVDALNKICAKFIGVSALLTSVAGFRDDPAGICNNVADMRKMALDTGALVPPEAWDQPMRPGGCGAGMCCTGLFGAGEAPNADGLCPLSFKIKQDGSGLGGQIVSGITQLVRFAAFDVVTSVSGMATGEHGEKLPAGKTTADFLKGVVPVDAQPPPPPPVIKPPVIKGQGFTGVVPGSLVRFNVNARNDFLMPSGQPQVFHATIKVLAGGCADLDQRDVIILIPPSTPTPG